MRYQNAKYILPPELVAQIQNYWQGGYLYIPREPGSAPSKGTDYQVELEKRNTHIFTKHLEGWTTCQLARRYNLSEPSIRRIILFQRKEANSMTNTIHNVLKNWELDDRSVVQRYPTVWEVGGTSMLKIYSDSSAVKRNAQILSLLHGQGVPTAQVIPAKDGSQYILYDNRYYLLTRKLEGSNVTGPIDTGMAAKMGGIIAGLHTAFRECEASLTLWENSLLDELNGWIRESLENSGWQLLSKANFEQVLNALSACYPLLPKQMIHRDVHLGNFLFSQGEFTGYIDFDLSQRNIRIFDICYFLSGLLASESGTDLAEPWAQIVKAAIAGYAAVNPLVPAERKAIPLVMESIEILFIAYFLSIGDLACASDAAKVLHQIIGAHLDLDK